jgi:hypothetical protein
VWTLGYFWKFKKNKFPWKHKKKSPKSCILMAVGSFFSAAPTAQNSPELHFRFTNYFIQPCPFSVGICKDKPAYNHVILHKKSSDLIGWNITSFRLFRLVKIKARDLMYILTYFGQVPCVHARATSFLPRTHPLLSSLRCCCCTL